MNIHSAWRTHPGKKRPSNEDNLFWNGVWLENGRPAGRYTPDEQRQFYTFAVCDGMGGERYGEVASMLAMKTLAAFDAPDLKDRMEEFIQAANRAVCNEMAARSVNRMGATVALLSIAEGRAAICNLGDSRIYRYDEAGLSQLSVDHRAEAPGISKGVLTQHLGILEEEFLLEPFVRTDLVLQPGEAFLLCSDGLTDQVGDEEIARLLQEHRAEGPQPLADWLVRTALNNGGKDNVTAMVIMIS